MYILGLDPGGTTGWCKYNSSDNTYQFDQMDTSTRDMRVDFGNRLAKVMRTYDDLTILCEKFEFRKTDQHRDKIDYTPGTVIGIVERVYASDYTYQTQLLIMQSADQAKEFWDDDKLRRVGLWKGTGAKHAMDALRHVLYYRTFTLGDQSMLLKLK